MGVSGSGKSTVGAMLAKAVGCSFLDADDFHPQENIDKMRGGIPLSEDDRIPWLETLQHKLKECITGGKAIILSCSALQKKYRDILRASDPESRSNPYGCRVKFVCLQASAEVIAARLKMRAAERMHFMPASLLKSQIELFQIDNAEGILMVDATLSPRDIVAALCDSKLLKGGCWT